MYNDTWNSISRDRFNDFESARRYVASYKSITDTAQYDYNNALTDKAKEAVPFLDYCAMIYRIMLVIDCYNGNESPYDNLSISAIADNVTLWANSKADKIIAMKACAAYDENEPYKLIIQANYERTKDEDAIYQFAYKYNDFLTPVICRLHNPKISEEDVDSYKGIIKNYQARCEQSCTTDEEKAMYTKWLESASKVNPHVGQKTSRFIRNLIITVNGSLAEPTHRYDIDIEYSTETVGNGSLIYIAKGKVYKRGYSHAATEISISQHEPFTNMNNDEIERKIFNVYWEKSFAEYADAINPVVFTRPTVLSLDYVDYILMSHGSGWESCHWINKDDATAGGCNSGGTWSYANDKVSYIMYTTSDDITESYELAEKITREVVIFDEEKHELLCDRLYPQSNDSGCSSVYTEHRLYAQKMIAMIYGYANYWNAFQFCGSNGIYSDEELAREFPKCPEVLTGYHSCAYPDYKYFKSSLNIPKEILTAYHDGPASDMTDIGTNSRRLIIRYMNDKGKITVGSKAICPICGNDISHAGDYHFICRDCAEDKNFCAGCGYSFDEDDLNYCEDTEDYRCSECSFYDDYAEEWYSTECPTEDVYDKDGYSTTVSENSCDRAIRNGDVFYCDECEKYYWTKSYDSCNGVDPQEDEDGKNYCPDCFERSMITCEECGCVVHKRNAIMIEGGWYCDDCAPQKLDDLEAETGEKYEKCDICNGWERASKMHIVYKRFYYSLSEERLEERKICDNCHSTEVAKCATCGREFIGNSMYTSAYIDGEYKSYCSETCADDAAKKYIIEKLARWERTGLDLRDRESRDSADNVISQMYNGNRLVRNLFSTVDEYMDYCHQIIAEGNHQ